MKSSLMNMRCLRIQIFEVHKCGTETPINISSLLHGTWTLATFASRCLYFRCPANLLHVTFFSLAIEKGESSPWPLRTGLDCQRGSNVARSWPDTTTEWFIVENFTEHQHQTRPFCGCEKSKQKQVLCNCVKYELSKPQK